MPTLPDRIENFVAWLDREILTRGLTDAELSRRGGIVQSVISSARAGKLPSWTACVGIARGLNLPAEVVFRAAGHLPPVSISDQEKQELDHLYQQASSALRRQVLDYLRYLVERENLKRDPPGR